MKYCVSLIASLFLSLVTCAPGICDVITYGGQGPTGQTSTNSSVGTSAATVTLTAASGNIHIYNTSASNTLYISFNGAATSSNFALPAAGNVVYRGVPVTSFSVIANASATTYSILAY